MFLPYLFYHHYALARLPATLHAHRVGCCVNAMTSTCWNHLFSFSLVSHNGSAVKNAWRVNNVDKGKWYVIFVKSPHAKEEWKKAFARERTRVQEDKETGQWTRVAAAVISNHVGRTLWLLSLSSSFTVLCNLFHASGFFVTDKMRRAALSLCSVPNTSRRKSMPRKTNGKDQHNIMQSSQFMGLARLVCTNSAHSYTYNCS